MNKKLAICSLITILVITLSSVSAVYATPAIDCQNGTSLKASITVKGFMEHSQIYDWTISKTMMPTEMELNSGQNSQVDTTIVATRQLTTEYDNYGVNGAITVKNTGEVATEKLQITVVVQYKVGSGQYKDLTETATTIKISSELPAGKTGTYQYSIEFKPVDDAKYRVIAYVTIANHSGHLGEAYGPEPKTGFTLPTSPTSYVVVDANAQLTDETFCPIGFSAVSSETGPWQLTDSTTINYVIDLANNDADVNQCYSLVNTATLTEQTTQQQHTDTATVTIHPSLFEAPEYWMGGLGGLVACIAAFAVLGVVKFKKP